MKRLTDYTKEELASITEGDYEALIDLECMVAGAPLSIEKPALQELPAVPAPDLKIFTVSNICFTDEVDARAVMKVINEAKSRCEIDYDYRQSCGSEYKYTKPAKDLETIGTKEVYTKETYESIQDVAAQRAEVKRYNDDIKESYQERKEARDEVLKRVGDAVTEACRYIGRLNEAVKVFERYLDLSDGNQKVAESFFKDSRYGELLEEVLSKYKEKHKEA